jgi:hypothetical protein
MQDGFWTKGLVVGLIMLFVGTSVLPSIKGDFEIGRNHFVNQNNSNENLVPLDQLDQSQLKTNAMVGSSGPMAQSFKPTLKKLTKVELFIEGGNESGDVKISIRDSLDGVNLSEVTKPENDFPLYGWVEFDIPDINVTPEKTYYIVWLQHIHIINGSWVPIFWCYNNEDVYSRGESWFYSGSWGTFEGDFAFKTYGYGENKPLIEIGKIIGGFGVSTVIRNNWTAAVTNVSWWINVSSGIILSSRQFSGMIPELAVNASKTIKSSSLWGIGSIIITVQADDASKQVTAFLLGPLVLRVA